MLKTLDTYQRSIWLIRELFLVLVAQRFHSQPMMDPYDGSQEGTVIA